MKGYLNRDGGDGSFPGPHGKGLLNGLCGWTCDKVKSLPHQLGKANAIDLSPSWESNQRKGGWWLGEFMMRNHLSVCKPEATSDFRAIAFYKDASKSMTI